MIFYLKSFEFLIFSLTLKSRFIMYANKIPNGQEYKQGGGKWYDGDRETKKIRKYKEF